MTLANVRDLVALRISHSDLLLGPHGPEKVIVLSAIGLCNEDGLCKHGVECLLLVPFEPWPGPPILSDLIVNTLVATTTPEIEPQPRLKPFPRLPGFDKNNVAIGVVREGITTDQSQITVGVRPNPR